MDHLLNEVLWSDGCVARCTCGWTSTPATTDEHAERRWRIHSGQQHAAEVCAEAWRMSASARARAAELARIRDEARERRMKLCESRVALKEVVERAHNNMRQWRPSAERTLECARQLAGVTVEDLWMRYFAYGGSLSLNDLAVVMSGEARVTASDYLVLSTVLNEEFRDAGFGYPIPFEYRG